ncbi:hypothetical protein HDU96_005077 [Phlyctochytrium bullatum]|nr:hypothetical protein HDU96_005077 [Phlyctochytrium bullatum]
MPQFTDDLDGSVAGLSPSSIGMYISDDGELVQAVDSAAFDSGPFDSESLDGVSDADDNDNNNSLDHDETERFGLSRATESFDF